MGACLLGGYGACLLGGMGACHPGKFWISGLLKSSLMQCFSNMAETCCKLAIVLANYIVDSYC